ncbi:MAG: glycosyltransferase [Treponema sp.]|nr:glycosyltransferase [Treponema sp.]
MISIAMTTYNGSKYLRKQIDSILNQTIKDFELIICDDASKDDTWQILEEYSKKDERVKIFRNENNLGLTKNFEKSISLCAGDYIALSDQDDIWIENHLELLINNINEATGVVGNAVIISSNGQSTNELISQRERYIVDGTDEDKLFRILFYGNPFQGASSLFKRELFEKALPIPEDVEYQDAWFNSFACCMNGFNFINQIVTYYRIHESNASGNHKLTFSKQIGMALKRNGWKTDRITYCNELLKRLPNMDKEKTKIILNAKSYHDNRIKGKRLKTIHITIKDYKRIYATNSYKQLIPRLIGIVLKG